MRASLRHGLPYGWWRNPLLQMVHAMVWWFAFCALTSYVLMEIFLPV